MSATRGNAARGHVDLAGSLSLGLDGGATLSPCRRYRYRLWRAWGSHEHRCVFLMINPSSADEHVPDPTVRKCVGFAKRWGFGRVDIVNLFAWRSPNVTDLLRVDDPVGPDNDEHLRLALHKDVAHRVVIAWGKHNVAVSRLVKARLATMGWLRAMPDRAYPFKTLGLNQDGSPSHPLMLAYATPLTSVFDHDFFPEPPTLSSTAQVTTGKESDSDRATFSQTGPESSSAR